ncbi:hypothetical protein [Chlorogloeopsis sp. ULAP02]|uniref:hypothetical protein n=1 Tax=Chlorogloeopsis sp. ULAP02 TaxID=3107926 RepID=UPI00313586BD
MFNKGNMGLLFIVFLIFVGFGDSFLPKPLSTFSLQTRTAINNTVIGWFPKWTLKTNPYKRTEKALENGGNKK